MAQHPRRRPAGPVVVVLLQVRRPLHQSARNGEDQRHRHVGGVLGQHAGGVRDDDATVAGGLVIDVVDPGAEVRDQLQLRPGLRQDRAIDPVRDGRNQHLRGLDGLDELALAHRLVLHVESRIEELSHASLDDVGELARDDDERFLGRGCHGRFCRSLALEAVPDGGLWWSTRFRICLTEGQRNDKELEQIARAVGTECQPRVRGPARGISARSLAGRE